MVYEVSPIDGMQLMAWRICAIDKFWTWNWRAKEFEMVNVVVTCKEDNELGYERSVTKVKESDVWEAGDREMNQEIDFRNRMMHNERRQLIVEQGWQQVRSRYCQWVEERSDYTDKQG